MDYKRLEIYVGWTCNQKCTYCMEFPTMEKSWKVKVSKYDILKKLIRFKKLGYNHVTYLGGEPFIQPVFHDALILGKKLGYKILVTTNCTTLHLETQASKFLPYIDELILSLEGITIEQQQKISRTKNYVHWDLVFDQIRKHWKGNMLKINIVITKDNLDYLFEMVKFSYLNGIKDIAVTYPDLDTEYYGNEFTTSRIAPLYKDCIGEILKIVDYSKENNIRLKLPDFPFCIFPKDIIEEYIKLTDDFDYDNRLKVTNNDIILDRSIENYKHIPRERAHIQKCGECYYKNKCWGPSIDYINLYGTDEILPFIFK